MKKILILALVTASIAAGINDPAEVVLKWNPGADWDSNVVVKIYQSSDVNAPRPWTKVAEIPFGTNEWKTSIIPGVVYFYATASNTWWKAESDPSNVASTPPQQRSSELTIQRGN